MKKKYNEMDLVLLTIFLSIAILILKDSYMFGVYISPDSASYLREARAILSGNWFNYDYAVSNMQSYFAVWPIGYPFLIAAVALITGANVYLASKILSIIISFIILMIFRNRFRQYSVIYGLLLINYGYLRIFKYTWSEQPFILGLIWFSFALYDISRSVRPTFKNYMGLCLSSLFLFLNRYIGAFSIGVMVLFAVISLVIALRDKSNAPLHFKKFKWCLYVSILNFFLIMFYLYQNIIHSGFITGQLRVPASETKRNLLFALARSQVQEISRLTYFIDINIFFVCGLISVIAIIAIINYRQALLAIKRYFCSVTISKYFFLTGIAYWLSIVCMRFSSHFDGFSYRLLYPATILFSISLIDFFFHLYSERFIVIFNKIDRQMTYFLSLLILSTLILYPFASLGRHVITSRKEYVGYRQFEKQVLT